MLGEGAKAPQGIQMTVFCHEEIGSVWKIQCCDQIGEKIGCCFPVTPVRSVRTVMTGLLSAKWEAFQYFLVVRSKQKGTFRVGQRWRRVVLCPRHSPCRMIRRRQWWLQNTKKTIVSCVSTFSALELKSGTAYHPLPGHWNAGPALAVESCECLPGGTTYVYWGCNLWALNSVSCQRLPLDVLTDGHRLLLMALPFTPSVSGLWLCVLKDDSLGGSLS